MERLISEITKTPGKHVKSSLPIFVRISHSDQSTINLSPTRELRFGLRFLNSYIFATLCRRPEISNHKFCYFKYSKFHLNFKRSIFYFILFLSTQKDELKLFLTINSQRFRLLIKSLINF